MTGPPQPCFSAVASIRNETGDTIGTGFAVGSGTIITCAHVVLDALGLSLSHQEAPTAPVYFVLPFRHGGDVEFAAIVDPQAWYPVAKTPRYGNPSDIALLRLPLGTALPANVAIARLSNCTRIGTKVWIKGASTDETIRSSLSAPNAKGHIQIDPESERRVAQPGFSGAPVWAGGRGHVVGMLVSRRATSGLAHAIPAALLAEATGVGLIPAEPESDDPEDNKKEMPSALNEGSLRVSTNGSTDSKKIINIDLDSIGRNEALGIIANSIVDAARVPAEKRARLAQINGKFRAAKAMLENFLEIDGFGVDRFLYDYSEATKKEANNIYRLISAGVDVSAIREYGAAAIDAAGAALAGEHELHSFKIRISGDIYRRQLFIKRLTLQSEESGLISFLEIEEVDVEVHKVFSADARNRLISELIFGLISNIVDSTNESSHARLLERFVEVVAHDAPIGLDASALSWIKNCAGGVFREFSHTVNSRSPLSPNDYAAYKIIFIFLATKNISVLYKIIAIYCRAEGRISTMFMSAMEIVISEISHFNIRGGARISRILRRVTQIRRGVIEPKDGLDFFEDTYKHLPDDASAEKSLCLYQISYFYLLLGDKKTAREKVMKALEFDETNVAALCFQAVIEMKYNRLDLASGLLDRAEKIDNSYIYVSFYRGVLKEEDRNLDEAIIEYIRCLILAPNFYEAALNLTNCLLDAGRILDAARLATAFLSKYSVPVLEFYTNIAVCLFQAGYSAQALKMLSSIYVKTEAPLVALNIAKIYFGRAQAGPCRAWTNCVLESKSATSNEKKEARKIARLVGNMKSVETVLSAGLTHIENSEEVGDALGLLLSSNYQLAFGTNNDLFQIVRRAIKEKRRTPDKFAPRGVLQRLSAEMKKAKARKIIEERTIYSENIKRGQLDAKSRHDRTPKSEERNSRTKPRKTMPYTSEIMLIRAPSYSAG